MKDHRLQPKAGNVHASGGADRPLLRIENLSVSFDQGESQLRAVREISLDLQKGESLALVGESGSGKTLTALAVMGLLPRSNRMQYSGHIWFEHPSAGYIDLLKCSESQLRALRGRHISMVFQEPMSSLNPLMRCGPQLTEMLRVHDLARGDKAGKRALELFERVQLPDPLRIFKAWPHQLSGGQRQRLMIAMAMACKPSLLIADEPTTALDVTVQKEILLLMNKLRQEESLSVLFISHDLAVVKEVATRAAVMRSGQLLESAPVGQLFSRPSHPYTRALIACRPPLDHRPERLKLVSDFEQTEGAEPLIQNPADDRIQNTEISRSARHKALYARPPMLEVNRLETEFITRTNLWGKTKASYKAVNKVSFKVWQGETLGLVGESGCGKTTLGRSIMRLIEPGEGELIYKGTDIRQLKRRELRLFRPRIQIIFQDPYSALSPGMTIGQAIREPMQVHNILSSEKERENRVRELLDRVELEQAHYMRYPHELSGGQRQRACIARALALNPEFLICDESVSALDVSVQARVLNLLNDLRDEFGLTYLFISHDLSVVRYMADRIMVMKQGQLLECREADALFFSPGHDYTRKLLAAIPG